MRETTKNYQYGLIMSGEDMQALHLLAQEERLPAAAVVRRLVWAAAKRAGLADMAEAAAKSATVSPEED